MPYCIQAVFILLGPALFAASVYMVLARTIRSAKPEKHSVIRIDWLTDICLLRCPRLLTSSRRIWDYGH
jgi:hypothetical protein